LVKGLLGKMRACLPHFWLQAVKLDCLGPEFRAGSVTGEVNIFEPIGVFRFGEILAKMSAAALLTHERAASDQFGSGEQIAHVEGLLPGEIKRTSAGRSHCAAEVSQASELLDSDL